MLETLYKPDSMGRVRQWSVRVEEDSVIVCYGELGGKIQEKVTRVYGKNLGKSNETTPHQQAIKVAEAKWRHQRDRKGYGLTAEEATLARMPMLAYDFHKHGHRIVYPAGVQPKLDGIRCLATKAGEGEVQLTSRTGKGFGAKLQHLKDTLDGMMAVGTVLDGELYCHGLELEDISSAVQKDGDNTSLIEFWVFDLAAEGIDNGRRAGILNAGFVPSGSVRLVATDTINSKEELIKKHKLFASAGFEGVMVRNREGMYKFNRRSADLQKYKTMLDSEFQVMDIVGDKDGCSVFVLADHNGTFNAVMVGNKEENKKYLANKDDYIGRWVTVQYFKRFRDSGLPQHPVVKRFRDCSDRGEPLL